MKTEIRARVTRLIDERCIAAGKHVAMGQAVITLGLSRGRLIRVLCIFCNRWERKWKETP